MCIRDRVTINQLVDTAATVAGTVVQSRHNLDAPLGVRGRNSNNDLIREKLGWDYEQTLEEGIRKTYEWISEQIKLGEVTTIEEEIKLAESLFGG